MDSLSAGAISAVQRTSRVGLELFYGPSYGSTRNPRQTCTGPCGPTHIFTTQKFIQPELTIGLIRWDRDSVEWFNRNFLVVLEFSCI